VREVEEGYEGDVEYCSFKKMSKVPRKLTWFQEFQEHKCGSKKNYLCCTWKHVSWEFGKKGEYLEHT